MQLKYADLPTSAVTLFGTLTSKCGSLHFKFLMDLKDGKMVLVSVNVL